MNSRALVLTAALLTAALVPVACKKDSPSNPSNSDYANAINANYSANPVCLWPQSIRMPTQQDTGKLDRTQGYDALTDLGYLQRLQAEKKVFIFGSKQVNDYDLTPQGRTAWIADPQQPGYGNFCFGHRKVTSVDVVNTAPANTNSTAPATARVQYHYAISDAAAWAKNAELQTAFPQVATALAGPTTDNASLSQTSSGWQMTAPANTLALPANRNGNPANDYGVVGQH